MYRIRGLLSVFCFAFLSAVALTAAVQAISFGLPETLASNAAVLLQALAKDDVASDPRPAQLALGERVQRELNDNVDWPAEFANLTPEQRERVAENVAELARVAFDGKVEQYTKEQSPRRKKRLLENQIADFSRWAVILDRANRPDEEPLVRHEALVRLLTRAAQWYREVSPERREELMKYQEALRAEMTKQMMRRINPNAN